MSKVISFQLLQLMHIKHFFRLCTKSKTKNENNLQLFGKIIPTLCLMQGSAITTEKLGSVMFTVALSSIILKLLNKHFCLIKHQMFSLDDSTGLPYRAMLLLSSLAEKSRPSLKKFSSDWHHMLLQNLYLLFSVNAAFTDVQVIHVQSHYRWWLFNC